MTTRSTRGPFFSLSAVQLEPLNGNGLAHAVAAMPFGSFVVAAHYRAQPRVHGTRALPVATSSPRTGPACGDFGCFFNVLPGDMFEHRDRWYWLMGIDLTEYRDHMRRRSAKWETVCLSSEDFRQLARPFESWL